MLQVKCIHKFRNAKGKIYGYRIQDISNNIKSVSPEKLRNAIRSGEVCVSNLTLTSNGRLIDCIEQNLLNTTIFTDTPINCDNITRDKFISDVVEIEKQFINNISDKKVKDLDDINVMELDGPFYISMIKVSSTIVYGNNKYDFDIRVVHDSKKNTTVYRVFLVPMDGNDRFDPIISLDGTLTPNEYTTKDIDMIKESVYRLWLRGKSYAIW